jgi:WD40 repeat protein
VRLWRTTDGQQLARLPAAESVHSVAFSPDGKLVLAGEDDLAELWRLRQPRPVRVLRAAKPQTTLALDAGFSADGARVLTSGYDHGIALWETSTGHRLSFMAGSAEAEDASLDASGRFVVGTAPDGWARLWRAASGKVERVLVQTEAENAAFSPDGALVAVASGDGTGRVWRTSDGEVVAVLSGHGGPVLQVPFSPDGRLVLTSGEDGTSRLWDALTGQSVAVYDVRSAGFTQTGALVETPGVDSTRLAPCDSCGSVDDLLALASRRVTRALTCEERRTFLGRAC